MTAQARDAGSSTDTAVAGRIERENQLFLKRVEVRRHGVHPMRGSVPCDTGIVAAEVIEKSISNVALADVDPLVFSIEAIATHLVRV